MFPDIARQVASQLDNQKELDRKQLTRRWDNKEGLAISRAYVRADDMARMIRLALEAKTDSYDVFWASAADTYDAQPTLDVLSDLFGALPEIRRPDVYRDHPRAAVFDTSAAEERLGWHPTKGWQETLDQLR
jgi:nucleoside-diphosphate-sugar epimerase